MIFCIKYKWYIITELTFLKELKLIREANRKSEKFVTIGIFIEKGLNFNEMLAMHSMIW